MSVSAASRPSPPAYPKPCSACKTPILRGVRLNGVFSVTDGSKLKHSQTLENKEKTELFDKLAETVGDEKDWIFLADKAGNFSVDLSAQPKDWRREKRFGENMDKFNNPLIEAARDWNKEISGLSSRHFVTIKNIKHKPDSPRYLILPRPSPDREPYEDTADFLSRATKAEKASLANIMARAGHIAHRRGVPSNATVFRANCGKAREIPYMHVHFQPPAPRRT